jgi:Tfp pilus assembly protein PilF
MICRQAGLVAKAERYLEEALKWDASNAEIQGALAELRQTKEAKGGFSIFGKR